MTRNTATTMMWRVLVMLVLTGLARAGPTPKLAFSVEPKSVTLISGEILNLPCSVSGRGRGDQVTCTWTKDGKDLTIDSQRFTQEGCNLVVQPVLVSDEGNYRCQAGGLVSQPAQVTVLAEPGKPYIAQAKMGDVLEVEEGRMVEVECSSQGAKPAGALSWHYGQVATEGFDLREEVRRLPDGLTWRTTSTFQFLPLEDQELVCSVHSEAFPEPKDSRPLYLKLLHKPKVTLSASKMPLKVGDTVSFKCQATSSPPHGAYKWFINDNEVIGQEEGELTLERIGKEHDKAMLRCEVSNSVGKAEASLQVVVQYEPQFLVQPQSVVARDGEEVKMECKADASPKPQYAWLRLTGEDGSKEEVVGVSSILIVRATKTTEGDYVCRVFVDGHPAITSKSARLALLRPPTVEVEDTVMGRLGQATVLQCKVRSLSENTTVLWTRHPTQGRLDSINKDMTRQRSVRGDVGVNISSELILPSLKTEDFSTYGCFAQNEAGTAYGMVVLEQEKDKDWLSMVIAINTLVGLCILAVIIVWNYKGKLMMNRPPERVVLPPIYRGEDLAVFDELILNEGMTEDFRKREYFDNQANEKKINLKIV